MWTTHELPAQRFTRFKGVSDRRMKAAGAAGAAGEPIVPREVCGRGGQPLPGAAGLQATGCGSTFVAEEIVFGRDGSDSVRHGRWWGKHQVARWNGPVRSVAAGRAATQGPPRFDPFYLSRAGEIEVRPLDQYEEVTR